MDRFEGEVSESDGRQELYGSMASAPALFLESALCCGGVSCMI